MILFVLWNFIDYCYTRKNKRTKPDRTTMIQKKMFVNQPNGSGREQVSLSYTDAVCWSSCEITSKQDKDDLIYNLKYP